ncbi:MAG: PEP-CTERM sorting domain-containing protein [Sedimentisphaerales bacterium]|nr:PEP-CTERM sorting domain-containing protein [Sedimentisphaerales bacterium]
MRNDICKLALKHKWLLSIALGFYALLLPLNVYGDLTFTVATFSNPAVDSSTPLFEVNFNDDAIRGGWNDSMEGLDLVVTVMGQTYPDTYFIIPNDISYTGGTNGGTTGGGSIEFYQDNDDPFITDPLLLIEFDSASVNFGGLYATMFLSNNVNITGSALMGMDLSMEQFSFAFDHHQPIGGDINNGFTATAAFTSSAVPEPGTLGLLGMGSLIFYARRRKVKK